MTGVLCRCASSCRQTTRSWRPSSASTAQAATRATGARAAADVVRAEASKLEPHSIVSIVCSLKSMGPAAAVFSHLTRVHQ